MNVHPFSINRISSRAFTLLEIMASAVIIGLLSILLFSSLNRILENMRTTKCVSHLRALGQGIAAYAADHDGAIMPWYWNHPPPADGFPARWNARLTSMGYVTDRNVFYCPSYAPYNYAGDQKRGIKWETQNSHTYGMREWAPPGEVYSKTEKTTQPKKFILIEKPSDFFIVADSYADAEALQGYALRPSGANSSWKIHLRHDRKANALFADGHVASQDGEFFKTVVDRERNYTGGGGFMVYPDESKNP